jgi:sialic acid synthase SpsE
MAEARDVEDALVAAAGAGAREIALFQCTVSYPTPPAAVNLRAMQTLAARFGVPVGLSDHSPGTFAAVAAVALGASLIEKHLTLSRALPGPDHPFALEPDELRAMVQDIRATEQALGSGEKVRHPVEEEVYAIGRRNLVAARDLPVGTIVTPHDLAVLRSPLGIAPRDEALVVGRRVCRNLRAGDVLTWEALDSVETLGVAARG